MDDTTFSIALVKYHYSEFECLKVLAIGLLTANLPFAEAWTRDKNSGQSFSLLENLQNRREWINNFDGLIFLFDEINSIKSYNVKF